ncbi:MAG TPA: hypothetical protein VFE72_02905 [Lysobacter sp.]|nr:hypothetical protein [Lysobacter sp.]
MLRSGRLKARKRSCPPPTVEEQRRRRAIFEVGCVIGWLRLGKRIPATLHHINTGGLHGQKILGEGATIGLNTWSHQGIVLVEYGWNAARCREELGPSFDREPAAFREAFDFDELLELQNKLIAPLLNRPSWMGP